MPLNSAMLPRKISRLEREERRMVDKPVMGTDEEESGEKTSDLIIQRLSLSMSVADVHRLLRLLGKEM